MRLCRADAVVTVSSMFGCEPNVFAYLTLDVSRSMGWKHCLVNAYTGYI